jgi:hypothetical protein
MHKYETPLSGRTDVDIHTGFFLIEISLPHTEDTDRQV